MPPANTRYSARQPQASTTRFDNGRDSSTPTIRPLITLPTVAPRRSGAAMNAAMGTSIWIAQVDAPPANTAAMNTAPPGEIGRASCRERVEALEGTVKGPGESGE